MYNLIRKDMLLSVNYFLMCIPISIVFIIAFTPVYPHFGYAMAAFAIAYMLTLSAPSLESRNHSEVILMSLPVLRSELIKARYLSAFVFTLIALVIIFLVGLLLKVLPLPWHIPFISWSNIFFTIISISIMVSIYFPVFYKYYNNTVMLFANIILFQLIFFMPSFVIDYFNSHSGEAWIRQLLQLNQQSPLVLPLLGLLLAAVLLLISYNLTLKIYSSKDF